MILEGGREAGREVLGDACLEGAICGEGGAVEAEREEEKTPEKPEPPREGAKEGVDGGEGWAEASEAEREAEAERGREVVVEGSSEGQGPSWIGEACQIDADCAYPQGRCLQESQGFPGGMCSQGCSRLCPDQGGKPGTFCTDLSGFPPATGGGCVSQCDFGVYPQTGCRNGYRCESRGRYQEPGTQRSVCLPGSPQGPQTCYQKAAAEGLQFSVRSNPKESPQGFPNLVCDVVDALSLSSTIHGVEWVTGSGSASAMLMRCELALALSKFSRYLASRGIKKVMHYGTYNCRTIRTDSGSTTTLSEHGTGRAIDLAAFWDTQGVEYNLVKHWDHATSYRDPRGAMACPSTTFNSPQAKVLYEIGCEMWKQKIFSLVLTPNYNQVHDNHFHVDLSSQGTIFSALPGSWIGPNPGH